MQSKATSVDEYIAELSSDRQASIKVVRNTILKNLPQGYEEIMQYGMISYVVPLSIFPEGYLGKRDTPLPYAALASQKNYMALYLTNIYNDSELGRSFIEEYKASGKKMDIGKSCVRFKKIDDLPLGLVGKFIQKTSVKKCIEVYKASRNK